MSMPMRTHLLIFANIASAECSFICRKDAPDGDLTTLHRVIYSCDRVMKSSKNKLHHKRSARAFSRNRCCPIEINNNRSTSLDKILRNALDLAMNTKPYLFVRRSKRNRFWCAHLTVNSGECSVASVLDDKNSIGWNMCTADRKELSGTERMRATESTLSQRHSQHWALCNRI